MLHLLNIASLISTCVQGIKGAFEPTTPAENWANKELYYKDMMDGGSPKQRMKNLKSGRYKLSESKTHPEPHRDENGKILVENCELFRDDIYKHGAYQAYKWAEDGKYNLP